MVHVLLLNHDRYVLHDPGTNCSSDDGVLTLLSRLLKKGDLAEDETCMAWRPPWKMKNCDLCFQSNPDKRGRDKAKFYTLKDDGKQASTPAVGSKY